jgi:mono/diheme cytochrome c family protein
MSRLLLLLCLCACDLDLERMDEQPRFTSYEACDICPNGTIMMQPPSGTIARNVALDPADPADDSDEIPVAIDRRALERGRNRFDIFCAACHGRLGNGESQVAENMSLRRPANLLTGDYRAGHIYRVVTHGFGLMRSYAGELPPADRWAVTAYVEALRLSQQVTLESLPPERRQEAMPWLP